MAKKQQSKKKTGKDKAGSSKPTIIAAVIIALVVGVYFGAVFVPAVKESSAPQSSSQSQAGDMSARIAEAKRMVEQQPGSADLWAKLGHLYFDSGQHHKAIDAYKASLAIRPGDSHVLTDLGVMYRRTDRPMQAVESFDKAIAASPTHETPYLNKGIVLYYDLQDKDGAIKAWRRLLKQNPNAKAPSGKPVSQMIRELS